MATDEYIIVPQDEVRSFVMRSMEASVGLIPKHATVLADMLLSADSRGHASHGLNKLEQYIKEIESGTTSIEDIEPTIVRERGATALVEGNNILGIYIARFCMDLAIKKCKENGIGIVSCRGSNHFGIAGWYSLRAMEQGLIGMALSNTSAMMVPTRAKKRMLGTNPFTIGAPGNNGDGFCLDMATTSVAMGKCELKDKRGLPLPSGWAVDADGKETHQFKNLGGLSPLGGSEESSGYKGYGLGMMVEILGGVLSGSDCAPNMRIARKNDRPANYGQCFIAIDPGTFTDGFTYRMQNLIDACRNLEPAGDDPVLVAGDPEIKHQKRCEELGGIPYHPSQIKLCNDLANRLKIPPLKPLSKY